MSDVELPPLPEPWEYCYEWNTPYGLHRKFNASHYNGAPCTNQVLVFTADHMRAYARAAVDAALEQAAVICDSVNNYDNPMTARDCADAIRALKRSSVKHFELLGVSHSAHRA
jgi:hypothetical protein